MTKVRAGQRSRRQTADRGLTLLELLVAGAVIAVLVAIALPFTLRALEERELSMTEEHFAAELLKARAEAQESGRPVEVVVEGAPSRIILRYFDPLAQSMNGSASDGASRSTRSSQRSAASGASLPRGTASGSDGRSAWGEESAIAPSIRVSNISSLEGTDYAAETGLPELDAAELPAAPMRVAVFLPDGTILFAASLMLMHESGLRSRVSVDPWTGQPAIDRAVAALPSNQDVTSTRDLFAPERSGAERNAPRSGRSDERSVPGNDQKARRAR